MKKKLITLFALLSMMAVSCQKENFTDVEPATAGETAAYSLCYKVDGVTYHATFQTKAERLAFIRQLVALTREGHRVVIGNSNTTSINSTKEKVTFTTSSLDEATAWASEMEEQGYEVEFYYDKEKGVYVCIAIK
jgi:hypothetical protein